VRASRPRKFWRPALLTMSLRTGGVVPRQDCVKSERLTGHVRGTETPPRSPPADTPLPDEPGGAPMRFAVVVLGSCLLGWLMIGCGRSTDTDPSQPPAVFSEHRFAARSPAARGSSLGIGGDCTEGGGAACETGLCAHVEPSPHAGYRCTARCTDDDQCPKRWRCVQTHPTPDSSLCIPEGGR
jgi:hypothetical protein